MTNSPRTAGQRIKPTLDTKFHIDYSWWERDDRDLRTYLISHLLPEQRERFDQEHAENTEEHTIDWIDPDTAEVRRVDSLQQSLSEAAKSPDFISDHITLVDAVFRAFLANGNQPLSPNELGLRINRQSSTILRTLSGAQVYKGIRPIE